LQWNYVKEHQQQRRRSAAEGKSYTISSLSELRALTKDACNSKSQVNNVNIKLTAECVLEALARSPRMEHRATSIHSLLNTIRITLHAGSLYLLIWLLCAVFGLVCYQFRPMRRPRFACGSGGCERVNLSVRWRHARRIMDQNYLIKTTLGIFFMLQLFLSLGLLLMELPWLALFFYSHYDRFAKKNKLLQCYILARIL
jgi:lysylphosphatidylglycerol synthetase-like protein (DUF2156 family)